MGALRRAVSPSHTLLPTLTSVLGREADLDRLLALVDEPTNRLVTITGPGGVGKTRLALYIAQTLIEEFARHVVFVPLAAIREPDLVLQAIAQTLQIALEAGKTQEDQIAQALEERSHLLILDNFEQVLAAAPAVVDLIERSPGLTVLVTSRAALGIPGEQRYPLAPLPTPSPGQTTADMILRSQAAALFVARARAVHPSLVIDDLAAVTVAEICRRLDGLPLAIELAAARVNILSLEALLARLDKRLQVLGGEQRGVPDRLQTMRHAIAWSYELLTPPEQALFRQMSVFAGGSSLEAVERVFQATGDRRDAWDLLSALVDHSLVQAIRQPAGDVRYVMLDTIRDYGLEQLDASGEVESARLAHAICYVELAEAAEPHLSAAGQEPWLNRLESEWENVRAAATWSLEHGYPALVNRIFAAIWRFCSAKGHVTESRAFLERSIKVTGDDPGATWLRARLAAVGLAEDQKDLAGAEATYEEVRNLAASLGETELEVRALIGVGRVVQHRGDFAVALDYHTRAAAVARATGDQRSLASALGSMASVSYFQGKSDDAERYWDEARLIVRERGDTLQESIATSNLGTVALERGQYDKAEMLLSRALDLQRRLASAGSIPYTLTNLGTAWRHLGDYARAEELLSEAIRRFREIGNPGNEGTALSDYAELAIAQSDNGRAAAMILESTRLVMEAGIHITVADNADLLAGICSARSTPAPAIELLAAADKLRRQFGAMLRPAQHVRLDELRQTLQQAVSDVDFKRQWQAGAGLGLEALAEKIATIARDVIGPQQPTLAPVEAGSVPDALPLLTAREREVMRLLVDGRSAREIGDVLYISPRTVTTHINNIYGKLGVSTRAQAVAFALRAGFDAS